MRQVAGSTDYDGLIDQDYGNDGNRIAPSANPNLGDTTPVAAPVAAPATILGFPAKNVALLALAGYFIFKR